MGQLTALPPILAAGTTVRYRRSYADYPASAGWALKLHLNGPESVAHIDAVADGDDFVLTLSATATAALEPGDYSWVELVSKSPEVHDPAKGKVTVTVNLATAAAGEALSWARRELAIIQKITEGRLDADVQAYQINGRSWQKIPIEQVWVREACLRRGLAAQKRGVVFGSIPVAFLPPGVTPPGFGLRVGARCVRASTAPSAISARAASWILRGAAGERPGRSSRPDLVLEARR
jgi:hypothetical protein